MLDRLIQRGHAAGRGPGSRRTHGDQAGDAVEHRRRDQGAARSRTGSDPRRASRQWDLGTGVTDNGTGSMVVLEAARAIAQSGVKPKRTIRFILFTGEEEGLLGSHAYAAAHAAEADRFRRCWCSTTAPA